MLTKVETDSCVEPAVAVVVVAVVVELVEIVDVEGAIRDWPYSKPTMMPRLIMMSTKVMK